MELRMNKSGNNATGGGQNWRRGGVCLAVIGVVAGAMVVARAQSTGGPPADNPPADGAPGGGTPAEHRPGEGRPGRDGMPFVQGRLNALREERQVGGPDGRPGAERMTEEEQARFRVFLNSYMPNVLAATQEVRNPRQRLWLTGVAAFNYRRYERGRRDFPQMEEAFRKDIKDSDDMVRLAREYPGLPASRQQEIRTEIRGKMKSVATSMLTERRNRIERLREQLEREERALIRDEERMDQGMDGRLEEILRLGARINDAGRGEPKGDGKAEQGGEVPVKQPTPSTLPVTPG